MKRMLWITGMTLAAAVMLVPAPREAAAFNECMMNACTRDIQCLPECPPCNGSDFIEGTCWYE